LKKTTKILAVSKDTKVIKLLNGSGPFQVVSFNETKKSKKRFMIVHRASDTPMKAASVFETRLQHKTNSPNTIQTSLNHLLNLYSWSFHTNHNLDAMLLSGEALDDHHVRSFVSWLKNKSSNGGSVLPYAKRRTFNAILTSCSQVCTWCASQFAEVSSTGPHRALDINTLKEVHKERWKDGKYKVSDFDAAQDMTDGEIETIENFLKPQNRSESVNIDIAVRDYLIWRLAIEFGMRIGEVLALRKQDCPTRNSPYFRIIKIEERGSDYFDPRNTPTRPKTLSHDLGIMLENSVFPTLVGEYITNNRYTHRTVKGRKIQAIPFAS
jgi:hypothetical protein